MRGAKEMPERGGCRVSGGLLVRTFVHVNCGMAKQRGLHSHGTPDSATPPHDVALERMATSAAEASRPALKIGRAALLPCTTPPQARGAARTWPLGSLRGARWRSLRMVGSSYAAMSTTWGGCARCIDEWQVYSYTLAKLRRTWHHCRCRRRAAAGWPRGLAEAKAGSWGRQGLAGAKSS